ncbi:MAG: hypothetical protein HQM08_18020 [Candidatus Riflebacteria bacterium]|nr:hypothetical protein [Candidatus Riflebacteria bacterium]
MNLVFLLTNPNADFSYFLNRLQASGFLIFGISDSPKSSLPVEIRASLKEHFKIDHPEALDQILTACVQIRNEFGPIERFETLQNRFLEIEAVIREKFGIFGPKPAEIPFFKKKTLMKATFEAAGANVPRTKPLVDKRSALKFTGRKYPVFIKPETSRENIYDNFLVSSEEELNRFFAIKYDHQYIIQEYLGGRQESFNGLTDNQGNIVFFNCNFFSPDLCTTASSNENLSILSPMNVPADLEETGRAIVKAAKLNERFFVIEFIRTNDGKLYPIDLKMAIPPHLGCHIFNYSSDIDVFSLWANCINRVQSEFTFKRLYSVSFAGRKYNRSYKYSHDEIVSKCGKSLVYSGVNQSGDISLSGNFLYLLRSKDEQELKDLVNYIFAEP